MLGPSGLANQDSKTPGWLGQNPLLSPSSNNLPHDRPLNGEMGSGVERGAMTTLFTKPADQEDDRLVSQRTSLPDLEVRLLLY